MPSLEISRYVDTRKVNYMVIGYAKVPKTKSKEIGWQSTIKNFCVNCLESDSKNEIAIQIGYYNIEGTGQN